MPAHRRSDGLVAAVRRLAAAGRTDAEIGRAVGRSPLAVCKTRTDHAIPPGRSRREWLAEIGRRRSAAAAAAVGGYGLPPAVRPYEAAVLLAALDGPTTAAAVAGRLGLSLTHVRTVVRRLEAGGLVGRVRPPRTGVRGGSPARLLVPTAHALDLIAGDRPEAA